MSFLEQRAPRKAIKPPFPPSREDSLYGEIVCLDTQGETLRLNDDVEFMTSSFRCAFSPFFS